MDENDCRYDDSMYAMRKTLNNYVHGEGDFEREKISTGGHRKGERYMSLSAGMWLPFHGWSFHTVRSLPAKNVQTVSFS